MKKIILIVNVSIFVNFISFGQGPGNYCGATPNPLTGNYEIPLNNNNFFFSGINTFTALNHVGIGYDCIMSLPGKLSVRQFHPLAINSSSVGVWGINQDVANIASLIFTGVRGEANGVQGADGAINRGGYFTASNSRETRGVEGHIFPSVVNDLRAYAGYFITESEANENVAVGGAATGSSVLNVGGGFRAGGNATENIALYAETLGGGTINYAAQFEGDVLFNGSVFGSQFGWSDQNLKTDINDLENSLDIIAQLSPKSFYYDTLNSSGLHLPASKQYGFIAQEVEAILPEMVLSTMKPTKYDSLMNVVVPATEFKTLNYNGFIAMLTEGIQEQQIMIEHQNTVIDSLISVSSEKDSAIQNLNNRLTQLENCLSGILPFLCQLSHSEIQPTEESIQQQLRKVIDIQLPDKNTVILDQNVPNPFAESTVITYSIPATIGKAQIHFYDAAGKLIQSIAISERGTGQLNIFGENLSKGIYTYTLIADGQIVSTKRMMKE